MRVTPSPSIVRSATWLTTATLLLTAACTDLSAPGEGDRADDDVAGGTQALITRPTKVNCDPEDPDFDPTKPCVWSNGWEGYWPNGYPEPYQQGWQKPWRNRWEIGQGQTGLTNSWAVAWSDIFGDHWATNWDFDASVNVWVNKKGGSTAGLCAHPVTQLGGSLHGCDGLQMGEPAHPIVQKVCDELTYCCAPNASNDSWDATCVAKAVEVAARHIPGSRTVLQVGGPLKASHYVVVGGHGTVGGGMGTLDPGTGGGSSGGGGKGTIVGGFGGSSGTLAPATTGTGGTTVAGNAGTIISNPSTGTVSDGSGGGGGGGGGKGGFGQHVDPSTGEVAQDEPQEEVLGNGSNACVDAVCKTAGSEYCCETAWDGLCVEQAIQLCSTQYLARTRVEHERVMVDACIEPRISGFPACPLTPTTTDGTECCRKAMMLEGVYTVEDTEELPNNQGGGLGRIAVWNLQKKLKNVPHANHTLKATFIASPCDTDASGVRSCEWTEEHKLWLMAGPVTGRLNADCTEMGAEGPKECNCNTSYREMCAGPEHQGVGMRGLLLAAASALITTNGLHEIEIRWSFGQGNAPFETSWQQSFSIIPREAHWYAQKLVSPDPANVIYRARASCYSKFSPQRADQDMVRNVLDCPEVNPNPNPEMMMLADGDAAVYPAIYSFYGQLLLSQD